MDDGSGPVVGDASESPLQSSVLVLNKHYVAVRIVPARRAFIFLCKGYAEAIDTVDGGFNSYSMEAWMRFSNERMRAPVDTDEVVRTPRLSVLIPRVIRLLKYDRIPKRQVKFNRRNIIARDGYRCQYCAKKLSASQLSIDHVLPKSRGGRSSWLNVVAACSPCNSRKGGRLPAEASMRLLTAPSVPRKNPLVEGKLSSRRYGAWRQFLGDSDLALEA